MFAIFLPECEESGRAAQRRDAIVLQFDTHSRGLKIQLGTF